MSESVEVKTADLVGAALDWAVGSALGAEVRPHAFCKEPGSYVQPGCTVFPNGNAYSRFKPSNDWSHGGPLIEAEELTVEPSAWDWKGACVLWRAQEQDASTYFEHTNLLVAAMRAVVHAKLGETVSVPKELLS